MNIISLEEYQKSDIAQTLKKMKKYNNGYNQKTS